MLSFTKATKIQARLRLALVGPAGSGKTYTALTLAQYLGSRVAVVDTEHGSASKYADKFAFDTLCLDNFDPRTYIEAIHAAEVAGYDVLVIDSLSHAWAGKGGALEIVDRIAKRSSSNNKFTAWGEVTPLQNELIDAIIGARLHVIATMRSKTEYILETNDRGKQAPRKVGIGPVQRDGVDYEFDVVGELDADNTLVVTKTRCAALTGQVIAKPGKSFADTLTAWLSDGAPAELPEPAAQSQPTNGNGNKQYDRPARVIHLKEVIMKARGKGIAVGTIDIPKLTNDQLEQQIADIESALK